MSFQVVNIIGGDTIEVKGWEWAPYKGKLVKIMGYTVSDPTYTSFANKKLTTLLKDKSIDLRNPIKADKGEGENNDVLFCSVFLNDVNIAQYFPELKDKNVA